MPRGSSRKAGRVVRRTLADGSVKTYRYPAYRGVKPPKGDTIRAMILAWERSPEWRKLRPSTQATYTRYLTYLNGVDQGEVTKFDRRAVLETRDAVAFAKGDGAANTFVIAVSALFGWGVQRGWITTTPCYRIERLAGGHYPTWTMAQVELALTHLREPLRRVVLLALYTGQRRGDLAHMTWGDYDGQRIRVRQEKTGTLLAIPCHPTLSDLLRDWRGEGADATTILTDARGRPWRPSHLSNAMHTALGQIPGFPVSHNVHGLRKLAATLLAEAGCTSHEIGAVTGHKSWAMLKLYTEAAEQQRLAGAAVLRFPAIQSRKTVLKAAG